MMHDIGDKLWLVQKHNHGLTRKKIKMVDDEGTEWYRYDKEVWTVELKEAEIIGRVIVEVQGNVECIDAAQSQYALRFEDDETSIYEDEVYGSYERAVADGIGWSWYFYFSSKEQAELMKDHLIRELKVE